MASEEQAKISRVGRRHKRLSKGVDEDDAVLTSTPRKNYSKNAAH